MKFRTAVEPNQPMRGLELAPDMVEALGGGKRPRVTVTVNGHSWKTRIAIMRGRCLIGLSNANRLAAGVATGDTVEVEVELDAEPATVAEPLDFAQALDTDPVARAAYDGLTHSRRRMLVHAIDAARRPGTRQRRIETTIAALRGQAGEHGDAGTTAAGDGAGRG